jgi:hypothetical protein
MRINEFITEKSIHKRAGLNVEPTDPRHPLYVNSIERYTGVASGRIADALHRMYRGKKFKLNQMIKTDIQMLDDIMYNHPIPSNIVVYHGVKESPLRLWEQHKVPLNKSIFILLPAFTSTSTSRNMAYSNFALTDLFVFQGKKFIQRAYLKINVPAGTPGLSVKKYSEYKREDEVLLGRGCVLQVGANLLSYPRPAEFPCKVIDVRPQELGFNENDTHLEEDTEFKFLGVA